MHNKVSKQHDSRANDKALLKNVRQKLNDAIENAERGVRVDRFVTSCEKAMTKAFLRKRTTP